MSTNIYERARNRTQEAIIDATIDLIMASGYDKLTITAIADYADIGRGTFYRYFDRVDEVLLHVLKQVNQSIYAEITNILKNYESPERERRAWIAAFVQLEHYMPLFRQVQGQGTNALWDNFALENLAGFTQSLQENDILYARWMNLPVDVMARFTSGAILSVMRGWFAGELHYSGEALGEMVFQLLYHQAQQKNAPHE